MARSVTLLSRGRKMNDRRSNLPSCLQYDMSADASVRRASSSGSKGYQCEEDYPTNETGSFDRLPGILPPSDTDLSTSGRTIMTSYPTGQLLIGRSADTNGLKAICLWDNTETSNTSLGNKYVLRIVRLICCIKQFRDSRTRLKRLLMN